MKVKLKSGDAVRNISTVFIGLTVVCTVVHSNTRVSVFREVNFQNGNIIASNVGVTSVFACLLTCRDTCGYVQYTTDGTCSLYSETLLLTEPAAVKGNTRGYRKVSGMHVLISILYSIIITSTLISVI